MLPAGFQSGYGVHRLHLISHRSRAQVDPPVCSWAVHCAHSNVTMYTIGCSRRVLWWVSRTNFVGPGWDFGRSLPLFGKKARGSRQAENIRRKPGRLVLPGRLSVCASVHRVMLIWIRKSVVFRSSREMILEFTRVGACLCTVKQLNMMHPSPQQLSDYQIRHPCNTSTLP